MKIVCIPLWQNRDRSQRSPFGNKRRKGTRKVCTELFKMEKEENDAVKEDTHGIIRN